MSLNLFSRTSLRFISIYFSVFCASIAFLAVITVFVTREHFEVQISRKIEHEAHQLMVDYNQEGLEELRHDVRERVVLDQQDRLLYSILYRDGSQEFDDIFDRVPEPGWHDLSRAVTLRAFALPLKEGAVLVVASDMGDLQALQKAVINNFAIFLFVIVALGVAGGVIVSQGYGKRLRTIRNAALQVGQGELSSRIPLTSSNDVFDEIASIINEMLTKIQTLVGEVQRVSSNIAHELRTPLGHIRQKIEYLQAHVKDNSEARKLSEDALAEVDHTLQIFSGILRLSEIHSGSRRSQFRKFDLGAEVSRICEVYEPLFVEKNRKLVFDIGGPCFVLGDVALLGQLVVNLIENVLEHTPNGAGLAISVTAGRDHVSLRFHDSGLGIRDLSRARQAFSKLHGKARSQGAGLGLSLVDAIVSLHGGAITYENKNGLDVEVTLHRA